MPDEGHARNAWGRWGDASNRSQYSSEEQSIIEGRIKRRCAALGVEISDEKKKEDAMDVDVTTAVGTEASVAEFYGDPTPAVTREAPTPQAAPAPVVAADAEPTEVRAAELPAASPADLLARAVEMVLRAGSEYSKENAQHLVHAHDRIAHGLNMACCGMDGCDGHAGETDYSGRAVKPTKDNPDPDNDGDDDTTAAGDTDHDYHRGIDPQAVAALATEMAAGRHIVNTLQSEIQGLKLERDLMRAEVEQFRQAVRAAEQVGLGRPTERPGAPVDPATLPYEERMALVERNAAAKSPYDD